MSKLIDIVPPSNCPTCGTELTTVNNILYCKNKQCKSVVDKAIQHHIKAMGIKGLGPASVGKLNLTNINELYELTLEELTSALGSEKNAEKVYVQLTNIKKEPTRFSKFLFSLGIPQFGISTSELVAEHISNLEDLPDVLNISIKGIGPKTKEILTQWVNSSLFTQGLHLQAILNIEKDYKKPKKSKGNVCITGKLNGINRNEAKTLLGDQGYTVTSDISKKTNFLVFGGNNTNSSKYKKAQDLGITITTLEQLLSTN